MRWSTADNDAHVLCDAPGLRVPHLRARSHHHVDARQSAWGKGRWRIRNGWRAASRRRSRRGRPGRGSCGYAIQGGEAVEHHPPEVRENWIKTFYVADHPDLRMMVYMPVSGTDTAARLAALSEALSVK